MIDTLSYFASVCAIITTRPIYSGEIYINYKLNMELLIMDLGSTPTLKDVGKLYRLDIGHTKKEYQYVK